jgi:hypothetical protein
MGVGSRILNVEAMQGEIDRIPFKDSPRSLLTSEESGLALNVTILTIGLGSFRRAKPVPKG